LLLRNKELTYELILERTDQPHENDTQLQNFGGHVNRVMQASSQVFHHKVKSKIKQVQEIITTANTLTKSLADLSVSKNLQTKMETSKVTLSYNNKLPGMVTAVNNKGGLKNTIFINGTPRQIS